MSAASVVKVASAIIPLLINVEEKDEYTRVLVLGIPFYDSRRKARRQLRRAARAKK